MERNEKLNEIAQQKLAEILGRRLTLDGYLVTLTATELSSDQKRIRAYVSIMPEKYNGTALTMLRKIGPSLKGELARAAKLREAPRINWQIDNTEAKAAELDEVFKLIEE